MSPSSPLLLLTRDRRNAASRELLLERVRGEFVEMPCLRLTLAQARRLFNLRVDICDRVLGGLVETGTLGRSDDGRYGLANQMQSEWIYAQASW